MSDLTSRKCQPCSDATAKLSAENAADLLNAIPSWSIEEGHHLFRRFEFSDFASALVFVNQIGEIAEAEGHHPNLSFSWGWVEVSVWTHKVDGLTENDFVLAAKIQQI